MAAPDAGGAKRSNSYSKKLDVGLAICHKQRKVANEVAEMTLIGDVEGKDVILIDDMVDTAGTLTKAADLFMANGASSVRAICTHAVLSGPAYERIENSSLSELVVTDSIPLSKQSDKITVLSVASLYSSVIGSLVKHESISRLF
jgi:ribose-phosphate pyrophosphokinase